MIGPPQWQIEAFQAFTIPDELRDQHNYPLLTKSENKILGGNAARLFGLDIDQARRAAEGDFHYKLRNDSNPPVHRIE